MKWAAFAGLCAAIFSLGLLPLFAATKHPIAVLIVDGQSAGPYHDWQLTTQVSATISWGLISLAGLDRLTINRSETPGFSWAFFICVCRCGKIAADEYERLLGVACVRFCGRALPAKKGAAEHLIDELELKQKDLASREGLNACGRHVMPPYILVPLRRLGKRWMS